MTPEPGALDAEGIVAPTSGVEMMRARLAQAIGDLIAGQITPAECNRISRDARRELPRSRQLLRGAAAADTVRRH